MNYDAKQQPKGSKNNYKSNSIMNRNQSKGKTGYAKIPLSKQNFLKQNKSIEKYLSQKFSEMDECDNDNTNLYLSTNNISTSAHVNSSIRSSTKNIKSKCQNISLDSNLNNGKNMYNSTLSCDKTPKIFCSEKSKIAIDNFSSNMKNDFTTPNEDVKIYSNYEQTKTYENNNNSSFSHLISKDETEFKLNEKNNIKTFQIDYMPPPKHNGDVSDSEKRLQVLKSGLIELINETKDKSMIIKELDCLYINLLKLQNPLIRNSSHTNPLLKDLSGEEIDDNIALNPSNSLTNFYSSSKSKPSYSNNLKELKIPDDDLSENTHLKQENKLLRSKLEELDEKFNIIHKENIEFKSYFNNKARNLDHMEGKIKKFEIELNEMKSNQFTQSYHNKLFASNEMNNSNISQPLSITANQYLKENQYIQNLNNRNFHINNENLYRDNSRYNLINYPLKQNPNPHKNIDPLNTNNKNNLVSNRKEKKNLDPQKINKNSKVNYIDSLIEEESPSILYSSISIPYLDHQEFNYLPRRVIYNNLKNNAFEIAHSNLGKSDIQMLDTDSESSERELEKLKEIDPDIKYDPKLTLKDMDSIHDSRFKNNDKSYRHYNCLRMEEPNFTYSNIKNAK